MSQRATGRGGAKDQRDGSGSGAASGGGEECRRFQRSHVTPASHGVARSAHASTGWTEVVVSRECGLRRPLYGHRRPVRGCCRGSWRRGIHPMVEQRGADHARRLALRAAVHERRYPQGRRRRSGGTGLGLGDGTGWRPVSQDRHHRHRWGCRPGCPGGGSASARARAPTSPPAPARPRRRWVPSSDAIPARPVAGCTTAPSSPPTAGPRGGARRARRGEGVTFVSAAGCGAAS